MVAWIYFELDEIEIEFGTGIEIGIEIGTGTGIEGFEEVGEQA